MKELVPASVKLAAFNCPHCGTFASQTWSRVHIHDLGPNVTPTIVYAEELSDLDYKLFSARKSKPASETDSARVLEALAAGEISREVTGDYPQVSLRNLSISKCYTCSKYAVWRHSKLIYPSEFPGPGPNADMPSDVREDFEEARTILNASPRGAAALLRLALQKLCKHLGESGKDINKDIGELVKKGLPVAIQQALDIVHVVGNESVHPGELNMRDDRETVLTLLGLINIIIDNRITQPNQIQQLYNNLPASKTDGIAARDAGTSKAAS